MSEAQNVTDLQIFLYGAVTVLVLISRNCDVCLNDKSNLISYVTENKALSIININR